MNTSRLKKFAQAARRKLLEQVGAKMEYVLTTDSAELREKVNDIKSLNEEIKKTNKEQVIEKVAYTWFNRLMALRFMDANDYQPSGIRIISPVDGESSPQILAEAKQGNFEDENPVDQQRVLDTMDGKTGSNNTENEAFRILLVAACNALHKQFPFLFERISDYMELLLPDDLNSEFSIVHDIVEGMTAEDCKEVEIIGWLYQFYISEKKDAVFAAKGKVKKEDIPAATQLFTPRWIVEYMVQNTVGKLWLQNNPDSKLRSHMPYFIESESLKADEFLKVDSIEELTLLDQACGSGHILVYGFELFYHIYEEEGYATNEIPKLIIEKNLHGFEIDNRAAQLAGFVLLIKARSKYRRLFKQEIHPNILCFKDITFEEGELDNYAKQMHLDIFNQHLVADLRLLENATNFGSLIQVYATNIPDVKSSLPPSDLFLKRTHEKVLEGLDQIYLLSRKFHCVVDNPPYMGGGNMNKKLSDFVKLYYPESKSDLMASFIEAGLKATKEKGYLGMINQHSWMFLSSYEKLRKKLIDNISFDTLLHLGSRTFPEIGGEVVQNASFTFVKEISEREGKYLRLIDYKSSTLKRTKTLEAIQQSNCDWFYSANQSIFNKISASPIGYWLSENQVKCFAEHEIIGQIGDPKVGIQTGDNFRFIREWFEIEINKLGTTWLEYDKGGETRKWYGNKSLIVYWSQNGKSIREHPKSVLRNQGFYFRESIQWSRISSGRIGARYTPGNSLFDINSASLFLDNKTQLLSTLGYLNSKVSLGFLKVLAPTLTFQVGDISRIPINDKFTDIKLVVDCIEISKKEWGLRETSFDFFKNELLSSKAENFNKSFDLYKQKWKTIFLKLKQKEEEINRQFIEIYGLDNELSPEMSLVDISILKEEITISKENIFFNGDVVFAQLISYSIGCIMGRYSLDKEGLILANQGETLQDYFNKVGISESEIKFLPDDDAIIPVLNDEWFEDDILGRFYEFLKVSFSPDTLEENLQYLEEQIGKDVRKWFVKDFYPDHIKRYKKRPIYWMFSSPKGHFNALVYLHRYTPDTLSNILNNYLRAFIDKLKARRSHFEQMKISGSTSEQNKAIKEIDRLDKMIQDCEIYERDILYPLATERIEIDLDDGVLVNYNKFGKAVKEVKGLNDKKAKEKVRKFDWIDVSKIRD